MSKKEPVRFVSLQQYRRSREMNGGSFINANGELVLPRIQPNCFGMVAIKEVPAEDIELGQKDIAEGYDVQPGDTFELWLGGIRNTPRKPKHVKATSKQYNRENDSCRIMAGDCPYTFEERIGKDIANSERLEALKDYYAKQDMEKLDDSDSPFGVSLADAILNNRALLALVEKETEKNDLFAD